MKNQKGFTLIELMIVVAIIAILAAIAIPQYQTYVVRSQVTRAMGEASDLKVVVEDCLNNGKTAMAGDNNAPTAGQCASTATASDILTGSQGGVTGVPVVTLPTQAGDNATIVATLGNHASTKVAGGTVTFTRDPNGSWTCTTDAAVIGTKYAPASCPNASS